MTREASSVASDPWIVDGLRTPLASPGALLEVQPGALLAGLVGALRERNAGAFGELDQMVVGAACTAGVAAATLARTLARAEAPAGVAGQWLEGSTEAGLDALRVAAAQLRTGEARVAIAGAIHLPSRQREQRRAAPDVLGALAGEAVAPRAAADLAASLQGLRAGDIAADVARWRAVRPAPADDEVHAVCDLNGLPILDQDAFAEADGAGNEEASAWQAQRALARKAFPAVIEMERIHGPETEAPLLEGASLLLVARADAAGRLGLRQRARIAASAAAGHRRLRLLDAAASAFSAALERAGWTAGDVQCATAASCHAGLAQALGQLLVPGDRLCADAAGWWQSNAGAVSSTLATLRLVREMEQRGLRRGAVLAQGDEGLVVVVLLDRGQHD